MMLAKSYYVVESSSLSTLMNEVNIWINKGWQPLGGISAQAGVGWTIFYQAIVRY